MSLSELYTAEKKKKLLREKTWYTMIIQEYQQSKAQKNIFIN